MCERERERAREKERARELEREREREREGTKKNEKEKMNMKRICIFEHNTYARLFYATHTQAHLPTSVRLPATVATNESSSHAHRTSAAEGSAAIDGAISSTSGTLDTVLDPMRTCWVAAAGGEKYVAVARARDRRKHGNMKCAQAHANVGQTRNLCQETEALVNDD